MLLVQAVALISQHDIAKSNTPMTILRASKGLIALIDIHLSRWAHALSASLFRMLGITATCVHASCHTLPQSSLPQSHLE